MPAVAGLLAAPGLASSEGESRQPGTNFEVRYEGLPGDDFTLGGGAGMGTVPQYNPRVLRVAPNGPAAAAGVRIGDEVVFVRLEDPGGKAPEGRVGGTILQESELRQAENVDKMVKEAFPGGSSFIFRACGVVQPGDQAPDFQLPDADGKEVSLADLRAGGKKVAIFFRPGRRFFGGDVDEIKLLARADAAFRKLGAAVVSVTTDAPAYQSRQASAYGAKFTLLSDRDGAVAQRFGALLDLANLGAVTDRKTFVLGADGRVEAAFPAVGWEASRPVLAAHIGAVATALGGDPASVSELALPRPKTLGDVVALSQQR